MALTHFRISKLGTRSLLEKNFVAIVLNESHPLSEQNELNFINNSGFKAQAIDTYNYQVSPDEIDWSNEGIITLNDFVDENLQTSSNSLIAIGNLENQDTNLYTPVDYLPVNSSTDRIQITGFLSLNGLMDYNGSPVNSGDIFFNYQFPDLIFKTLKGGGEPYQEIYYKCGNHLGFNATIYKVTIDVSTLAELLFINRTTNNGSEGIYDKFNIKDSLKVTKGYIGTLATINIDIASPMFGVSPLSYVLVDGVVKTANENYNIVKNINNEGEVFVNVEHIYVDSSYVNSSSVVTAVVTLIDGDSGKVSGTDTYISTASFTSAGTPGGITSYRSSFEGDGWLYSGWLDGGTPFIKRTKNGVTEVAQGVTDLEPDWINRLSLTYV